MLIAMPIRRSPVERELCRSAPCVGSVAQCARGYVISESATNDVCRHGSGRVSVSVPKSAVRDGSWVFFVHCGLSIIWRQQLLHTPGP